MKPQPLPPTPRSTDVPALDRPAVSAACVARMRRACPEQLPLAEQVLGQLDPARWTLEWFVPWWLGSLLALDGEVTRQLVVSNVLGLASLRLQDDLADGEIAGDQVGDATALSAMLYEEAVAVYRPLVGTHSPFWAVLAGAMAEWRAVTDDSATGRREVPTVRSLARRGAPLKISAYAACLLAERADLFPAIETCLDHALAALVLHDHAQDWREDLSAGRWNAYVARLSRYPQDAQHRDQNRSAVLMAMMTSQATRRYYARIDRESSHAARLADRLDLWPLAAHLRGFGVRNVDHGTWLQQRYHRHAEDAAAIVFGPAFGAQP